MHPSLQELQEQLASPVSSSIRVVTQVTGSVTKFEANVEIAGSTYKGTKNSSDEPAVMAIIASKLVE